MVCTLFKINKSLARSLTPSSAFNAKMMSQAQTQVVILDSSSHEDIFVCGLCKRVFNSLHLFLNHKKEPCIQQEYLKDNNMPWSNTSSTNNTFNNSFACSSTENREKQMQLDTKAGSELSCKICKKEFKTFKYLCSHLKLHEKPAQCPICGRCFQNTSHQKRHLDTHKVWPDGLNETTPRSLDVELLSYSCSYCEAVLSNYTHFRAHLNNHLSLKKFKCIQGDCNRFFDNVEALLHHVAVAHDVSKYTCHVCKKDFESLRDIAIHQKNYQECGEYAKVAQIHLYKCNQCDATFRKAEKLSLHLLTENHNKACVHCKKAFASDKRLRMHLLIHRKSKRFHCNICSSSFHMRKYLTTHMLKHGDRQFACTVCKQSFKRQDMLQRHMRIHGKKKLKCPFKDIDNCTKEFNRRDKLKQHLSSHAKKLKLCSKQNQSNNTGTMEICIVPLDTTTLENEVK